MTVCKLLDTCKTRCVNCLMPFEYESLKLKPCHKEHCQFSFEESFGVKVLGEFAQNHEGQELNAACAANAVFSGRSKDVFEPFPTFMLKKQEMRSKAGFLDGVKEAKAAGKEIGQAAKTDSENK